MMESAIRLCLDCSKPLKGRIDKKFCDDYCRNNFNNKKNSHDNNFVRNIINVLRKNRRILAELLPEQEEKIKVKKEKLQNLGFNFVYLTHNYITQKNQIYHFCFEYGYLNLEEDWILIVKRQKT